MESESEAQLGSVFEQPSRLRPHSRSGSHCPSTRIGKEKKDKRETHGKEIQGLGAHRLCRGECVCGGVTIIQPFFHSTSLYEKLIPSQEWHQGMEELLAVNRRDIVPVSRR